MWVGYTRPAEDQCCSGAVLEMDTALCKNKPRYAFLAISLIAKRCCQGWGVWLFIPHDP